MPDDLADAFRLHWVRHFGLPPGSRLVVAVSGGIDSMTLLALLGRDRIAGEGVEVVAAHFDHGTREPESGEDGRFVRAVAGRWGVRARLGRGDAPARAAAEGRGPQAAARALRYRFLVETAREAGAAAVATAHQRDDRVETALLRIVRGTSPDGLAGPRPIEEREGTALFRPLLPFSRAAIARWAEADRLPYRDDPSNRSGRYPRTRIREEVLPVLRSLNPRVDEAVVRLAALAAADAAVLNERAAGLLERATVERAPERWSLAARTLAGEPDPVLSRALVALWAWGAPPGARPPNAEWIEGAAAFVRGGRGGTIECPGGGTIRRAGSRLEARRPDAGHDGEEDPDA